MIPSRITIHCSASKNGASVSIEEITKWHIARGFHTIGYHFVVDVDGKVKEGRSVDRDGAHVEGANTGNLGICLIGTDKFSQSQFASLRSLVLGLCWKHDIPYYEVWCHYQFKSAIDAGKSCPNIPVQKIISFLHDADLKIFDRETLKK